MDEDYFTWADIIEGKDNTPETFDRILKGYRSATDAPVGAVTKEVYAAYPNAKFILTVRDPAKWEISIKSTILEAISRLSEYKDLPSRQGLNRWFGAYQKVYHKGRLNNHAIEEFEAHTERVKNIIPADQLLVYRVGEGWHRLAEFLGVPEPNVPFPHLNDSETFARRMEERVQEMEARRATEITS